MVRDYRTCRARLANSIDLAVNGPGRLRKPDSWPFVVRGAGLSITKVLVVATT